MKLIIIILINLFVITSLGFGEETKTLDEILGNAVKAPEIVQIRTIMEENVYSYFNIKLPPTELQTKVFKKEFEASEDYKNKKRELAELKKGLFEKLYFLKLNSQKGDYSIRDYDITKKYLPIELSGFFCKKGVLSNLDLFAKGQPAKAISDYIFNSLPIQSTRCMICSTACGRELHLHMSEEDAMQIEKARDNIEIYLIFKIASYRQFKYYERSISFIHGLTEVVEETSDFFPVVNEVRFLLVDNKEGKIYYDKTFKSSK